MEMKMKKTKRSKSSSLRELPLDLMMDILARLDWKSLLQIRCVSKTWCQVIDNPNFSIYKNNHPSKHWHGYGDSESDVIIIALEHNRFYKKSGSKFVLRSISSSGKFTMATEAKFTPCMVGGFNYYVCGCVHGLLLLRLRQFYILWNPFTRKSLPLPLHPLFLNPNDGEYEKSNAKYSLGFDHSSGDFKVVTLAFAGYLLEAPGLVIGVYSCSTGYWRSSSFDFENSWLSNNLKLDLNRGSVSVMGAVSWLGYDEVLRRHTHVISFDFSSDAFNFFTLPDHDDDMSIRLHFVLGQSLAVFYVSHVRSCIWVMKKDGGGGEGNLWTKWYSNDLSDVDIERYEFFKRVSTSSGYTLLFLEKSRKFLMGVDGEVYSYDIESHKRRALNKSEDNCRINYMDFYVESLALGGKGVTGSRIFHFLP